MSTGTMRARKRTNYQVLLVLPAIAAQEGPENAIDREQKRGRFRHADTSHKRQAAAVLTLPR